ncbi:MAG: hypothetical protein KA298_03720 [Paludibacteraceae bacterium]|jgi:hypothetical protein|nr:hypothetical protein [Paludibacteraceae bacterium]MBP6436717.1 hypothetical protein [Paludibacteraceae bacterium]MBP8627156.1 hypothetical protein [Paludibacteraceae bacterium]MBP8781128.1 hypothetical protein [Paludibacteraceae bacterium]MBP9648404.1 hypothetical protein [Paludibacteraceae bacterium]
MVIAKRFFLLIVAYQVASASAFAQLMPDTSADKDALSSWELWLTVFVAVLVLGVIQYVKYKNKD